MVNKKPERLHYMSSFYLPSDSSRLDDEESRNQRIYWRCIRYSQKKKRKEKSGRIMQDHTKTEPEAIRRAW